MRIMPRSVPAPWYPRFALATLAGLLAVGAWGQANPAKILDGKPHIIINGHQWSWGMTVQMDALKAVGITNWVNKSGEYNTVPIDDSLHFYQHTAYDVAWHDFDYRNNDTPVVLVSYINTGRTIRANDTARINLEVRKLRLFADTLRARGIDWVIYTTRHKRLERWSTSDPYDDASDTLVLKEYDRQLGGVYSADVYTKTAREFPLDVVPDFEHPGGPLHLSYTTAWLKAIYAHDGLTPPAILDSNLDHEYDLERARRAPLSFSITSPARWDTLRTGQNVNMTIRTTDKGWINVVGGNPPTGSKYQIRLVGYVGDKAGLFIAKDSVFLKNPQDTVMNVTFAIPDSAPVAIYSYLDPNMYAVKVDSAFFQVNYTYYNGGTYQISKTFRIADRDGKFPTYLHGRKARPGERPLQPCFFTRGNGPAPDGFRGPLVDPMGRLVPLAPGQAPPASGAWFPQIQK